MRFLALLLGVVLGACDTITVPTTTPDGRSGYRISTSAAQSGFASSSAPDRLALTQALKKDLLEPRAREVCPDGYEEAAVPTTQVTTQNLVRYTKVEMVVVCDE